MTLIHELNRKCLADDMLFEGVPAFNRSDNGPQMAAKALRQVDVLVPQGSPMTDAIRQIWETEAACTTLCFLSYGEGSPSFWSCFMAVSALMTSTTSRPGSSLFN